MIGPPGTTALVWHEIINDHGLPSDQWQAGIYEVVKHSQYGLWVANVYPDDLQSWSTPASVALCETPGEAMQACEDHMIAEITRRLTK